jgi:metal-responsive CopG/Arc/MetJ family transcriptional regulator
MKKRISITLSTDLLSGIDRLIGPNGSRSAFIEKVLSEHIQKQEREAINQRDFELINANADRLNREAEDVLSYQADIFEILEDQANTQ